MRTAFLSGVVVAGLFALTAPAHATTKAEYRQQVSHLKRQRAVLRQEVRDATAQRDQALAGLPDAIRAVPYDRFTELVLDPALAVWRCDSVYRSSDFWSVTFDSAC